MNTHNHHKIIVKVSEKLKNNLFDVEILKKASDFTDDFCDDSEWDSIKKGISNLQFNQKRFFYFHFYYDIKVDKGKVGKGTISLLRRNENNTYNQIEESMSRCDYDKIQFEKPLFKDPEDRSPLETQKNYKKFFTYINDRERYLSESLFDSSNQSDCVAFLHAMGAAGEAEDDSLEAFIEHLKNCFTEFLFLKNQNDALFILGIALHSIMDSFTPSHMGFQKYTEQDMANHAQGDVIVFDDDYEVTFDPGQYTPDGKASNGKTKMAAFFKGYNSDDHISDKEFEMFKIFAEIGDLTNNKTIKDIIDGNMDLTRIGKYNSKTDRQDIEPRSLKVLNEEVLNLKQIRYGEKALVYSKAAIKVCTEVFQKLSSARQEIGEQYEKYKIMKINSDNVYSGKNDGGNCIMDAINSWEQAYYKDQELKTLREEHLKKGLYKKSPSFMEKLGKREMSKHYGGLNKFI